MPFDFGIKDIIDILLVALMLYYIYRLMKGASVLRVHDVAAAVQVCKVVEATRSCE